MDLMTHPPGLVTDRTLPATGPYSAGPVTLDVALDQIVSSHAPVAQAVNGYSSPTAIADLISSRLGMGATTATVFVSHHRQLFAVSGVVVGVSEMVIQFADEHAELHTWPTAAVIAVIAD